MFAIKIVLAMWMAAFWVLPECPCQLLAALGVDFPHRHLQESQEVVNPDYDGTHDLQYPSEGSGRRLPYCHCAEGVGRVAEECEDTAYADPAASVSRLAPHCDNFLFVFLFPAQPVSVAPPPLRPLGGGLEACQICVYRL